MSNPANEICKILKISKKKLIKLKRKSCENWDSLAHLEIIFIIEIFLLNTLSKNRCFGSSRHIST